MKTKNFFGGYSLEAELRNSLLTEVNDNDYSNDSVTDSCNLNVNASGLQQAMTPINTFSININIDNNINKETLAYIFDRIERIFK